MARIQIHHVVGAAAVLGVLFVLGMRAGQSEAPQRQEVQVVLAEAPTPARPQPLAVSSAPATPPRLREPASAATAPNKEEQTWSTIETTPATPTAREPEPTAPPRRRLGPATVAAATALQPLPAVLPFAEAGAPDTPPTCSQGAAAAAGDPAVARLKQLCPLMRSGKVWRALSAFLASPSAGTSTTATLPVFVADLEYGEMGDSTCARRWQRSLQATTGAEELRYAAENGLELLLPELLRQSRYATPDPAKARLALAAACIQGRNTNGEWLHQIDRKILYHARYGPLWARIGASRFALAATGTRGMCRPDLPDSAEKLHPDASIPGHAGGRINFELRDVVALLHDGSRRSRSCYQPGRDIVVPTLATSTLHPQLGGRSHDQCPGQTSARPTLVLFAAASEAGLSPAGKALSEAMRAAESRSGGAGTYVIADDVLAGDEGPVNAAAALGRLQCLQRQAVFCAIVRGKQRSWGAMLELSLDAGCVPVLMIDDFDHPWSDIIDYSVFTVQVPEARAADTPSILAALDAAAVRRLQEHAILAAPLFRYPWAVAPIPSDWTAPGAGGAGGGDGRNPSNHGHNALALDFLMFSLAQRMGMLQ